MSHHEPRTKLPVYSVIAGSWMLSHVPLVRSLGRPLVAFPNLVTFLGPVDVNIHGPFDQWLWGFALGIRPGSRCTGGAEGPQEPTNRNEPQHDKYWLLLFKLYNER